MPLKLDHDIIIDSREREYIKRELYAVEGEKLVRKHRTCPRCGAGIFLAEHADRYTCGKCGYTEFKKKK